MFTKYFSATAGKPSAVRGACVPTVDELPRQLCVPERTVSCSDAARAARIRALPLDYMDHEQFHGPCAEKWASAVLDPPPENDLPANKPRPRPRVLGAPPDTPPNGLPAYLAGLYEVPLLTREQETHLFRKMNYLKYQASKLRERLVHAIDLLEPPLGQAPHFGQPQRRLMDRIESLFAEAVTTKNQITSANLRLVVSIAKRHVGHGEELFELISDGNLSLIRAVEKFDISRGNRFSTYATWAIIKNFARSIPAGLRYQDRFRTSHAGVFGAAEDRCSDPYAQEQTQRQCESQVKKILGCLDERELQIVTGRFGLGAPGTPGRGQEPLTLVQVGAAMGVSKERIRQIQTRAMAKLRTAATENITNTGGDQ